ncbi:protein of unknown function [Methanoculleus bourgensis]|uniref:Uncharacterized protein n=1 Tax=Methanoculleus bourgensis TaxID=83986 RepID=A0A0X3BMU8_9EURY|nr:protein of unknown function [Methanoculleus bourgensis]
MQVECRRSGPRTALAPIGGGAHARRGEGVSPPRSPPLEVIPTTVHCPGEAGSSPGTSHILAPIMSDVARAALQRGVSSTRTSRPSRLRVSFRRVITIQPHAKVAKP